MGARSIGTDKMMANDRVSQVLTVLNQGNPDSAGFVANNGLIMRTIMSALLGRQTEDESGGFSGGEPHTAVRFSLDNQELTENVAACNRTWNVEYPIAGSNCFKVIIKRALRKLSFPFTSLQRQFNAYVTRTINGLVSNDKTLAGQIAHDCDTISELKIRLDELEKEVVSNRSDQYSEIDYQAFENEFRGTEDAIKQSQRQYIHYFEGKRKVLELGCGRGEFLELLKENDINAIGIDKYVPFINECRAKNLNVIEDDAAEYLHCIPDNSVDVIFAAQLIEHLSNRQLVRLCIDAYRKMTYGGCLIMETPNPRCMSIYTNAFYIDPSHVRPVHPEYVRYLLKKAGFTKVQIVYTESSRIQYRLPMIESEYINNIEDVNNGIYLLSDILFGSQDYAVIAIK